MRERKGRFDQCGDELMRAASEVNEEIILESLDEIAPSAWQSKEDAAEERSDATLSPFMHPEQPQHTHYDIGGDIGLGSTCQEEMIIKNRLTDDEYLDLVHNLNDEQLSFFNHVLYITKTSSVALFTKIRTISRKIFSKEFRTRNLTCLSQTYS